jgi:hypothetical protein
MLVRTTTLVRSLAIVLALGHPSVAGAARLDRDNPQTQERLFP